MIEAKQIDWSLVPDWAEYVAMDGDGSAWAFEEVPNTEGGCWDSGWGNNLLVPELANYIDRDQWRSSLVRRPAKRELNPNTSSLTDSQAREAAKETGLCSDGMPCRAAQHCDDCPNVQDAQLRDAISPGHYRQGCIECIDAIKAATVGKTGIEAACVANVIKYLWRYEEKNGVEDVRKAIWYIKRLESELSD